MIRVRDGLMAWLRAGYVKGEPCDVCEFDLPGAPHARDACVSRFRQMLLFVARGGVVRHTHASRP